MDQSTFGTAPTRQHWRRLGAGAAFVLTALLVVATLACAPFAIIDAYQEITTLGDGEAVYLTRAEPGDTDYSRIAIKLLGINEVDNLATLQFSGFRVCEGDCPPADDRLVVSSYNAAMRGDSPSVPATTPIPISPSGGEVSARVTVPITGRMVLYPFDAYALRVGIAVERAKPGGQYEVLKPDAKAGNLVLSFDEDVPRLDASAPVMDDPLQVTPSKAPETFRYAFTVTLTRPTYTKLFVVLFVTLVWMLMIYFVAFNSFQSVVLNAGGIILGLWGVRVLLVGAFPPESTVIDLVLLVAIIFVLVSIAARSCMIFARLMIARD